MKSSSQNPSHHNVINPRFLDIVFNRPVDSPLTYICTDGETMFGKRVIAPLAGGTATGYVIRESIEPPKLPPSVKLRSICEPIDNEAIFDSAYLEFARWLAEYYMSSIGEVLSTMIPLGKPRTKQRNNQSTNISSTTNTFSSQEPQQEKIILNSEQDLALRKILDQPQSWHYLYGVTGSGKTEVFLRAAETILQQGKGVIYLIPEIVLSHQLVELVETRFAGTLAVLHSRLSPSKRMSEWRKIQRGTARLVIGARSAIFAPMQNIGLIIIDEEHDGSYKSGSHPRYHARQVAMYRSKQEAAGLIFGSATPSVEAWYNIQEGRFAEHRLSTRHSGLSLPKLGIVDIKHSAISLSPVLLNEMRETLGEGRQVLLFLNRRGFGYFFHCRNCGEVLTCKRCSVSLIHHKAQNRMICHYCGYQIPIPSECPHCSSLDLGFSGFGTEKIEEDLKSQFPLYTIARLDGDIARKKGAVEAVLNDFRKGKTDILLGTQMIAKGLNVPKLSLVGVILADSSLHIPDFRSLEKTFALITQVAGRSGRYEYPGKVILQTLNPQHHIIRYAAENRIEEFYKTELDQRRELRFPPFSRILRLIVRGKVENKVWKHAQEIFAQIQGRTIASTEILGPSECPIAYINNKYRVHIMILCAKVKVLQSVIPEILKATKRPSNIYVEIDLDPQTMT